MRIFWADPVVIHAFDYNMSPVCSVSNVIKQWKFLWSNWFKWFKASKSLVFPISTSWWDWLPVTGTRMLLTKSLHLDKWPAEVFKTLNVWQSQNTLGSRCLFPLYSSPVGLLWATIWRSKNINMKTWVRLIDAKLCKKQLHFTKNIAG